MPEIYQADGVLCVEACAGRAGRTEMDSVMFLWLLRQLEATYKLGSGRSQLDVSAQTSSLLQMRRLGKASGPSSVWRHPDAKGLVHVQDRVSHFDAGWRSWRHSRLVEHVTAASAAPTAKNRTRMRAQDTTILVGQLGDGIFIFFYVWVCRHRCSLFKESTAAELLRMSRPRGAIVFLPACRS